MEKSPNFLTTQYLKKTDINSSREFSRRFNGLFVTRSDKGQRLCRWQCICFQKNKKFIEEKGIDNVKVKIKSCYDISCPTTLDIDIDIIYVKKILILIAFIFIASTSTAQEILAGGILEAYWADNWNDEATVNTPHLGARYLTANKTKFIVLIHKREKSWLYKVRERLENRNALEARC